MPVMKCSNGKWKIGRDGDCKYTTKEDAEKAQEAYYAQKNEGNSFEDEFERLKELSNISRSNQGRSSGR